MTSSNTIEYKMQIMISFAILYACPQNVDNRQLEYNVDFVDINIYNYLWNINVDFVDIKIYNYLRDIVSLITRIIE